MAAYAARTARVGVVMSEQICTTWLYRKGDLVRWAQDPSRVYRIIQRRWTDREVISPLYEYALRATTAPPGLHLLWSVEADIEPWEGS